ncbi:hypothetical protein Rhopal_007646-T1 [Rhodotorula paludigena]|uniref:Mitochondrial carrier n=1 Tax=Rhodotorula paludigena TaxID=86838 RepID=A0AAV5GWG5_9BASI|nr:hypothetical protein Rhopal_007646-T1 [Rhodotorula paludigena]
MDQPSAVGGSSSDPRTHDEREGVNTTADLVAGWLGGAVGVIVGNPFEHSSSSLRAAGPVAVGTAVPQTAPSAPHAPHSGHAHAPSQSSRIGIVSLYRSEGIRFFFAGTAGPILGLSFIDSAFFGIYGQAMERLRQDRQDPSHLSRVFLSGAGAGALCAMLETPIEVVKTRAQVESVPGKKLGSFRIASQIARKEGLRGFYVGGLMTATHDAFSSGTFFVTYFVLRRLLRGEDPFHSAPADPPASSLASSAAQPDTPAPIPASSASANKHEMNNTEILRILASGGIAGAISAVVPYPFDIVKTRLQTADFEARARSSPAAEGQFTSNATPFHTRPDPSASASASGPKAPAGPPARQTIASVFRGIHAEAVSSYRYRFPSTWVYQFLASRVFPRPGGETKGINPRAEKWALRLLGLKGFTTGIRPTVVSSFVGSAATITTVEVALHLMGVNGGGGVG